MSSLLETIADDLAREALAEEEKTGDETIVEQVSKAVGTSSPTFQEAFNTAVRMRRAEAMGRAALDAVTKKITKAD